MLARLAEEGCLGISADELAGGRYGRHPQHVLLHRSRTGGVRRGRSGRLLTRKQPRVSSRHVVVAGCLVQRFQHLLDPDRFPDVDLFCEISDYRGLCPERHRASLGTGSSPCPDLPRRAGGLREARERGRAPAVHAAVLRLPPHLPRLRPHVLASAPSPSIRGPASLQTGRERSRRGGARARWTRACASSSCVAEDSTAWGRDLRLGAPRPGRGPGRARRRPPAPGHVRLPEPIPLGPPHGAPPRPSARGSRTWTSPPSTSSTPVLRAMRRAGSGDQVRANALGPHRSTRCPGITLRSTLLVGFPGETGRGCRASSPSSCASTGSRPPGCTFTFSPEEPGTPAFELGDHDVPVDVAAASAVRRSSSRAGRSPPPRRRQALGRAPRSRRPGGRASSRRALLGRTPMDVP